MAPDFFCTRLIQLIHQKKAPHFIIFSPSSQAHHPVQDIQRWYDHFLAQLAPQASKQGHQDVLTITPNFEQSRSGFTMDHVTLQEWFETQHFKPIELPVRVIAVHEAQYLSESIQNKCLRLLEEPQHDQLILWFKSSPQSLLPTIESRAMQLRLPLLHKRVFSKAAKIDQYFKESIEDQTKCSVLLEALHKAQWQEVAQCLQKEPELEKALWQALLAFESHQEQGLKRKAQLLQNAKWFQEAAMFGNANAERWTTLLSPYFPS